jgi:predicted CxxxxCH...CXXCH cytochrome family protein
LTVRFTTPPNSGGTYNGDVSYPNYLPSQNQGRNGTCTNLYCHSDGRGGAPTKTMSWGGGTQTRCYSCHKGRTVDNTPDNCADIGGTWDAGRGLCTPYVNISSNGHSRLVGPQWIRKYPCTYCHNATVDADGNIIDVTRHVNGAKDVVFSAQWAIVGRPAPSYNPATRVCDNIYCHSDGTANPDTVRPFAWSDGHTSCNTCHGHPQGSCANAGCHDGRTDAIGNVWTVKTGWPAGDEWKSAMPMYSNTGPGTARANSHPRHLQTGFACDNCHVKTVKNGTCNSAGCHTGTPSGQMGEVAHLDGAYHVNKTKDVVFRDGGSYNPVTKTCSNTLCHGSGPDPQWGGSVNDAVVCLNCHGTTGPDVDSFTFKNFSTQAKINTTEFVTTGHGRPASAGPFPVSGNPAPNFPGNPCWYCHDNTVIHNDPTNPFRLRIHQQFSRRFDKECVYCHMQGLDSECLGCHNSTDSLAPQLATITSPPFSQDHKGYTDGNTSCVATCHPDDAHRHKTGTGLWTPDQQADIRNQYLRIGVCLKCHDDDSEGQCTSCHTAPADNPFKYALGFNPGSGFVKPQKARASSVHFGYKHYKDYQQTGVWKGGKFCWDCHDPHGDSNIYMIQSQVATSTDGVFGKPVTRAAVSFTRKQSGQDYARISAPYNGICNVCHTMGSQHYRANGGDGHNSSRICTTCHEHKFTTSHASGNRCNTCHLNKPVPRHTAFGLPRDCTKCHAGTIGNRMDIMGQMQGTSHHVQGTQVTNKHCYACHWESTPEGIIDVRYHLGYNYQNHSSAKNAPVSLVLWGPGTRPTTYKLYSTAIQFLSANIGTVNERTEVAKITNVCLGCHSDQNNDTQPFGDCRTPRQYAWDRQSVAARYTQTGTTTWGKYNSTTYPNATQKDKVVKAFSAHGNAAANQGGWSVDNGVDATIPNTRNGGQNVQCFDCHSSHGSKLVGVTSSYVTFNGTNNGANLKETQAGKGGYSMSYKAAANSVPGAINPYNAGAGQCFDCHLTATAGTTPWGYNSTFGASAPINGYMDSDRFGVGGSGYMQRATYKTMANKGGHLHASSSLSSTPATPVNGLCTPCHDPHGVSPTLGSDQAYGVPLLKGTWLTSPYKEDRAQTDTNNPPNLQKSYTAESNVNIDNKTFGPGATIAEDETRFAGLCLKCHAKTSLTNGTDHTWKGKNRIHEAVKGWKTANTTIQHNYSCSKCHAPHVSGLPRLMQTNCLDFKHRGSQASGGQAGWNNGQFPYSNGKYGIRNPGGSFPRGTFYQGVNCHPTGTWPDNSWNNVTPW